MRRPGTYTSEVISRACSSWQPQLQRPLPAQLPQQYQLSSRSHEMLLNGQAQREQLPLGADAFTAVDIGHRRRFLNPQRLAEPQPIMQRMRVPVR